MLSLTTGLPGHGKTLRTLSQVEALRDKSGRVVYQSGIPDLTLPWHELPDPKNWASVPDGSIIVIDECQRVFPPRASGSSVPEHVRGLETHRHRGLDFFLVTQHPRLLDSHVRSLIEVHENVKRPFGQKYAKVTRWQACQDNPARGEADAEVERWKYPKSVYAWYRSATQHTVQPRLPWQKVLLLLFVVGFLAWAVLYMRARLYPSAPLPASAPAAAAAPSVSAPSVAAGSASSASPDSAPRVLGVQEWSTYWRPVLREVPASAPAYQAAGSLRPLALPRVAGCLASRSECSCYSQQGTRLDLSPDACVSMLTRPPFDPYRPDSSGPNGRDAPASSTGGPDGPDGTSGRYAAVR